MSIDPTLDWDEEMETVKAAQSGCDDAFRRLVEIHQQRVYKLCFQYVRDAEDARDLCQETFVKAHRALESFRPKARFSTWLFRIALNLCHDRARRKKVIHVDLRDDLSCEKVSPDEALMRDADLEKLERGLASLPKKARALLVMSCLDGMSHEECADVLRCSERAVEGRLYRARRLLVVWWEKETG